ncbi:MAG: hypothetical protein HC831_27560 [Chloroflexia bacterium]|nr:hypothetical protein [Chloroflexia bacterium]
MKNIFKISALLVLMSLFVVACEDVKVDDPQEDTEAIEDNALAAASVRDVFASVNDGTNSGGGKTLADCPQVLYVVETKTLTIDYGTGCQDDPIARKGLITVVFSGTVRGWENDETATISFTDYYIGDVKFEGNISITCNDVETSSFGIVAQNMVLTFPNEQTIKWSSNETIARDQTYQTAGYWRYNGGTTGTCTLRNGETFSRTSTNLLSSPACKWFIDGSFSMTIGDNVTVLTFSETCGTVKIKRNNLPEFEVTL